MTYALPGDVSQPLDRPVPHRRSWLDAGGSRQVAELETLTLLGSRGYPLLTVANGPAIWVVSPTTHSEGSRGGRLPSR